MNATRRSFFGLAAAAVAAGPAVAKGLAESASALPVPLPTVPVPPIPVNQYLEAHAALNEWRNLLLQNALQAPKLIRWSRVNDEKREWAIISGQHGDEFLKDGAGQCISRPLDP